MPSLPFGPDAGPSFRIGVGIGTPTSNRTEERRRKSWSWSGVGVDVDSDDMTTTGSGVSESVPVDGEEEGREEIELWTAVVIYDWDDWVGRLELGGKEKDENSESDMPEV
ncbi:hypothetical protein PM082_021895 [Marasmius tenuissimus]|nr:hypothetical protein PM082_021895 [Marasmius tenuissimus]